MQNSSFIGLLALCVTALTGCGREATGAPAATGGEKPAGEEKPSAPAVAETSPRQTVTPPVGAENTPSVAPVTAQDASSTPQPAVAASTAQQSAAGALGAASTNPVPQTAVETATEMLRKQSWVLAEKRKAFLERERTLRTEDEECVRLVKEAEDLRRQLDEREAAIRERLDADPELKSLRNGVAFAQREYDALQRKAAIELRLAAGTNATVRPPTLPPARRR